MRGVQAQVLEIVVELLDPRLVLDRRVREIAAAGPIGRVLAGSSVDVIKLLRLGVKGLEVLVGHGPGWRDPAVVVDNVEVLGS